MNIILSIIIPVYNVEKYIDDCLRNLIKSTSSNFEIILVDDGSTDNSGRICDFYQSKDSRIRSLHKENGGLSSARNYGMKFAKGKWFSFVDSDDVVAENYVDHLLRIIVTEENVDILMFKYTKFNDGEKIIRKANQNNNLSKVSKKIAMYNLTIDEWGNYAWNKIYKRYLFNSVNYPIGKNYEDIFTTYKLFAKASNFIADDNILYYYRQRQGSIQHQTNLKKYIKNSQTAIQARLIQLNFFKLNHYNLAKRNAEKDLVQNCISYCLNAKYLQMNNDESYNYCFQIVINYKANLKYCGLKKYLKIKLFQCNSSLCYLLFELKKFIDSKK